MAASQETQSLKGPAIASALAAAVAWFTPGGQVAAAFLTTFATSYALQGFAMREARKASLQDVAERKSNIRSAQAPHRIIYGHAFVGGVWVNAQVTGADKEFMHMILAVAGTEVHSIGDVWFEDVRVTLDGSGNITAPANLAGLATIRKRTGAPGQVADSAMTSESGGLWTSSHVGNGIADIYAKIKFDQDKLFSLPTVRALVRGRKCLDPRTGLTRLTMNPAIILRDYLTADFGMQMTSDEIDVTALNAAADACDEWVAFDAGLSISVTADAAADTFATTAEESRLSTGDRVRIVATGVPAGLAAGTDYYLIRVDGRTFQLAADYQSAIEGTPVGFTSNGAAVTFASIHQRRYTLNGSITLDQAPKDIVEDMLGAMAGNLVHVAGKVYIHAGAYVAPTITITPDDLRGPLTLQNRKPRRELVNQIRGSFVDASRFWVQSSYPPVGNAGFIADDGGVTIERTLDHAFATDTTRAQRLAKIALQRSRAGGLSLRLNLSALRLQGFDTVAVTIPQINLSGAVYRIVKLDIVGDDGGIGVDLSLQEESAAHYAWSASDAVAPPTVPRLDVPAYAQAPAAPTSLTLASGNAQLLQGADGAVISRIQVSWARAVEPNLSGYEIQYKRASESAYNSLTADRDATSAWIAPVEDGVTYDVRVRALAAPGARRSAWLSGTHPVVGKTANPTAPTSLAIVAALGGYDLAWSQSPDADYATSTLMESLSNDLAAAYEVATVTGNRFSRAGLPGAVTRYYWVRHNDRSGNQSSYFPVSATAGVSAVTLSPSGGGVRTVTNASAITAGTGSPPPGGDDYWAVFSNHDGKIWRWSASAGAYTKAADGGDLVAGSVAADKIAVANLAAISANLGSVTAGSIDIGGGKFAVDSAGNATIRSGTTGQRLEVTNNVIRVYDASGVLRVKIGDLS